MKLIPLTQGKFAQVDDRDYEWLIRLKWCARRAGRTWYAVTNLAIGDRQTLIGMHQAIAGTFRRIDGFVCDHIDGDGLNNQRANLRRATTSQNAANKRKPSNGESSQFKGVSAYQYKPGWFLAYIKGKHIGAFPSEEEAARAYDRTAREEYGPFAKLNFPEAV